MNKLETLRKYAEEVKKKGIKKDGPTITISGLTGSGKSIIGETISKELKLRYVSQGDIFRQLGKEQGMDIYQYSEIRGEDKDIMLDKKTIDLAAKGNIVINARIAGWVAGDLADVKVWIGCDLTTRAKRVAKRENKSITEAKKDLQDRDKVNNDRYQELYGIDANDKSIYDYVFDNSKASFKEATTIPVKQIKKLLEKK